MKYNGTRFPFLQKFNGGLKQFYAKDWKQAERCFAEILEQFDYTWEYRPGRKNVADPLSRIPESLEEQVAKRKSQMAVNGIMAMRSKKRTKKPASQNEVDNLAEKIQKAQ